MSQISYGADGKYRWVYEFNLYKNPTILFVIYKIFGAMFAIGIICMLISSAYNYSRGYADMEDFVAFIQGFGIFIVFWFALSTVSYYIYAAMQGGKYCVLFEMDELGIIHRQYQQQIEKAQLIGALNVLMGAAGSNSTQIGIGLTTGMKEQMISNFSSVISVKGYRRREVIKVNEILNKNQVYTAKEDYDFVFNYIVSHCPQAKIKA